MSFLLQMIILAERREGAMTTEKKERVVMTGADIVRSLVCALVVFKMTKKYHKRTLIDPFYWYPKP